MYLTGLSKVGLPGADLGLRAEDPTIAELLKPLSTIRNTIVIVGSHDNTLDVLADQLRAGDSALTLSSSHVGSMGGLMAVKRGVCHLAGATQRHGGSTLLVFQPLPDSHLFHLLPAPCR